MRIPILFGEAGSEAEAGIAAWLVEDGFAKPPGGYAVRFALAPKKFGHAIGCACCSLRGPAADALTRMFRARATGAAPYFKRVYVLASPEGEAALREALERDAVTAARYVDAKASTPTR